MMLVCYFVVLITDDVGMLLRCSYTDGVGMLLRCSYN